MRTSPSSATCSSGMSACRPAPIASATGGRCSRRPDHPSEPMSRLVNLANSEGILRGAILMSVALLALPAQAVELIGTQVPPYPAGLNSLGGSCLGDPQQGEDVCAWSIGVLGDASGAAVGVYAARLLGR